MCVYSVSLPTPAFDSIRSQADVPSLGASGSCMAVVATFATMAPRTQFLIFGVLPMQAWIVVGLMCAYDAYGALFAHDNVGHAGHLAGAASGAAYYLLVLRRGRGFR